VAAYWRTDLAMRQIGPLCFLVGDLLSFVICTVRSLRG
jgi:hypothetical protein